ncbi:uncharacterized protein BDZ99DRAFT_524581 [Mytilinidion resinicola]|uniref:Uncharacterized protein n=1 Tax=Mytilinidion resinicola TaxID=574789 RepID=A0A6A6Y9X3_9PEZI|nr:uncharacterized protein BDZ99DRAFT_524581 [Mytilinidion resinicola]KAF2805616.1 hypothetical protein BDZ99DRAFT_524581 [Mytilinidion resinicola]
MASDGIWPNRRVDHHRSDQGLKHQQLPEGLPQLRSPSAFLCVARELSPSDSPQTLQQPSSHLWGCSRASATAASRTGYWWRPEKSGDGDRRAKPESHIVALKMQGAAVAQPDDAASRRFLNLLAQGPSSVQKPLRCSLQEASNIRRKRSPSKSASVFLRKLAYIAAVSVPRPPPTTNVQSVDLSHHPISACVAPSPLLGCKNQLATLTALTSGEQSSSALHTPSLAVRPAQDRPPASTEPSFLESSHCSSLSRQLGRCLGLSDIIVETQSASPRSLLNYGSEYRRAI